MNNIFTRFFKNHNPTLITEAIKEVTIDEGFISLSPINNVEDADVYITALKTALKRRDINRNIALTGPYGSGKSSILRTFESNNTDEELVFLNISLATFAEENGTKDDPPLPLIEISILQQMFYHEKDEDIPDTRFKKVRNFPKEDVKKLAGFVFGYILSMLILLMPNLLTKVFVGIDLPLWLTITTHYVAFVVVIFGTGYLILKSIRPIRSIQLKKFNFQDMEFAIEDGVNKSVLNEHLDEILYFFEVTKYTVVVIEDLDRFEQTKIFTKLRELNHLINYSKKIDREVAFIYAVRDEIFSEKERAKFFDFILPVIPVINSANSESKLTILNDRLVYGISSGLIDKLSYFIDDMRLLYNILNEFRVYREKVKPKEADKLFAIILYKNMYPEDFVKLSDGEGQLFSAIGKKKEFISEQEAALTTKIDNLKTKLKEIEQETFSKLTDLRKIYLWECVISIDPFLGFELNSEARNLEYMIQDEPFEMARTGSSAVRVWTTNEYGSRVKVHMPDSFSVVEKRIDKNRSYGDRVKLIEAKKDGSTIETKKLRDDLEQKLKKIRSSSFKDLMADEILEVKIDDKKQNRLVNIMLRYGYLDENYHDYISIFHVGSLTKGDQEYLLNVRAHLQTDYSHELIKIDKLISKLDIHDFERQYALNYYILDKMLASRNYSIQLNAMLSTLSVNRENYLEFVDGYLDQATELDGFVKAYTKACPEWWSRILNSGKFADERVIFYLKLLVESSKLEDLSVQDKNGELSDFITSYSGILRLIDNGARLKEVIKLFDIKFENVDIEDVEMHLVKYIYDNNHYQINFDNIRQLAEKLGQYDESYFEEKNYTSLQVADLKIMAAYMETNIVEYVTEILLKREFGGHEEAKYLERLLNNPSISIEHKYALIDQSITILPMLNNISELGLKQYILSSAKVTATWDNVANYFNELEMVFDEPLTKFLEQDGVADNLATNKLQRAALLSGEDVGNALIRALFLHNALTDETYERLLDGMIYSYGSGIDVESISGEKAQMLIEKKKLLLSADNFVMLRKNFIALHIILTEQNTKSFIDAIEDYPIDTDDALRLMESSNFSIEQKGIIIGSLDVEDIKADIKLSAKMVEMLLKDRFYNFSKETISSFLMSEIDFEQRLTLFDLYFEQLERSEIKKILAGFPEPYNFISKGKPQTIFQPISELNRSITTKLIRSGILSSKSKEGKNGIRVYRLYN